MQNVSDCIARSRATEPGHWVCVHRAVNDTEIPHLAANEESREIGSDWRAMLSLHFAEDKLQRDLMIRYVSVFTMHSQFLSSEDPLTLSSSKGLDTLTAKSSMK